jgi:hypothetical protein
MKAQVGDRLIIKGHRVHEPDRDAEILEVRGIDGGPPYVIQWSDSDHETVLYPGSDALIQPRAHHEGEPREGDHVHHDEGSRARGDQGAVPLGAHARSETDAPSLSEADAVTLLRRHIELETLRTTDSDTELWALWREEVASGDRTDSNADVLDRVLARLRTGE